MKLWLNRIAALIVFFMAMSIMYEIYDNSRKRLLREERKESTLLHELESKIHRGKNLRGYRQQLNQIEQELTSNLAISSFFKKPKESLDWCVTIEKELLNGISCQLDELIESELYYQQNILFEFNGSLTDVNQFLELFSSHSQFDSSAIALNAFTIRTAKGAASFWVNGTLAVFVEHPYEK